MNILFSLFRPHATMRPLAAAVLIAALSGCGGGGDNTTNNSSVQNIADNSGASEVQVPDTPPTDQQDAHTQPVDTSFVDKLFLADSASGFYQFDTKAEWETTSVYEPQIWDDTSEEWQVHTPIRMATGKWKLQTAAAIRSYLDPEHSDLLKEAAESVVGSYEDRIRHTTVLTGDRKYELAGNSLTLVQKGTKVFNKTSTGLELGSVEMSSPLYRVTFEVQDVSGQDLSSTVLIGSESMNNGLPTFLGSDTSPMPQGSEAYIPSYESLQPHIDIVHPANRVEIAMVDTRSLEEVQASVGGTIKQLGQYRYLVTHQPSWTCREPVYVDYIGIHAGCFHAAGEVLEDDAGPKAFNRVAADFIANRLRATVSALSSN